MYSIKYKKYVYWKRKEVHEILTKIVLIVLVCYQPAKILFSDETRSQHIKIEQY